MNTWTCWRDASHLVKPHPLWGWPQCAICRAAPAYHERSDYLPDDLNLLIFVPASQERTTIAPGSAIVGVDTGDGRTLVYYEGWVNGPMQYKDRDARGLWEAGLLHASGRMVTDYPTIGMASLPAETLRTVGIYAPRTHSITLYDEEALDAWLNPA